MTEKEEKIVIKENVDRFSGFADTYHLYRPIPPEIITEILVNYIGKKPSQVVDLGCGTGLSTFIWRDVANSIIGIDPNDDMLNKAKDELKKMHSDHILFKTGYGNATGLEENSADVITCSSSFQWMEPNSTIEEVLRLLTKGGVFAMYNNDWPPSIDWVVEKAYGDLFKKIYGTLDQLRGEGKRRDQLWSMREYLDLMRATGGFSYIREVVLHSRVKMDAEGFTGVAFSQGALQEINKMDNELMKDELQQFVNIVRERMGNRVLDATYCYRMWVAVK